MTYGDTSDVTRNYALLTIPFKRLIVEQYLKNNYATATTTVTANINGTNSKVWFYGVTYDPSTKAITNYGEVKLLANIYNTDESMMSASQFSPATTPTIILKNEVSSTGTDATDDTQLPYYMNQAKDAGYTNGYVVLSNLSGETIPGYMTQMMATTSGSNIVTTWVTPASK
jgi:hypothetical protein